MNKQKAKPKKSRIRQIYDAAPPIKKPTARETLRALDATRIEPTDVTRIVTVTAAAGTFAQALAALPADADESSIVTLVNLVFAKMGPTFPFSLRRTYRREEQIERGWLKPAKAAGKS